MARPVKIPRSLPRHQLRKHLSYIITNSGGGVREPSIVRRVHHTNLQTKCARLRPSRVTRILFKLGAPSLVKKKERERKHRGA